LDIKFFSDDHRGVVLKKNLSKDEIFIKIPKDLLISLEVAKSFPEGQQVSNFMYTLNSPKHCLLTTFVLYERLKKNSKWKSYFEILPKDYTNFPIFFDEEELNLLKGSPFLNTILEKKEDIEKDYKRICELVTGFSSHSFRDFCEIRMAVSSRIFGIKIENKKTDVLAPFADLLNHKRPRQTHWLYDEGLKSFVIQALENIPVGGEVIIK
jgi:histone-lysine N-methyltransferase SETD3